MAHQLYIGREVYVNKYYKFRLSRIYSLTITIKLKKGGGFYE